MVYASSVNTLGLKQVAGPKGGAPFGNQHAAKGAQWRNAINRALAKRSAVARTDALTEIADRLLGAAMMGDVSALRELGDRMDGKSAQQVMITGADGGPVVSRIERVIVDAGTAQSIPVAAAIGVANDDASD